MFLIDQTGTGANFFTADNPYIALIADPVSSIWPKPLADFLTQDGPPLGIKRVAVLYATNDFTGTQASAVRKFIKESNSGVEIVFDQGVPTETSNYTVLLNNIRASNPDAVIHIGYAPNDIAFLRNVQDSGIKFKLLFCVYPGIETELLEKNLADRIRDQFRHVAEGIQRRMAQEVRQRPGRVRLQFGGGLHHRAGAGKDAGDGDEPRAA